MPVHIEELTSEVDVVTGELPLTEEQTEKLVKLVLTRLKEKQYEAKQVREATSLRREAAPPVRLDE